MAKKVFVTGGSGFVGWNLTNFLLDIKFIPHIMVVEMCLIKEPK
jgi:nucleoside-diphosphate-sugar epimerase